MKGVVFPGTQEKQVFLCSQWEGTLQSAQTLLQAFLPTLRQFPYVHILLSSLILMRTLGKSLYFSKKAPVFITLSCKFLLLLSPCQFRKTIKDCLGFCCFCGSARNLNSWLD